MTPDWKLGCVVSLLGLGLSSCFFGYDSRWGQQKQAQQHLAARATPEELRRSSGAINTGAARRTLKLRVYTTPAYTAAVVDWQKQFGAVLDCANSVFVPDFGVTFEVAEARLFRPKASEEKLDGLLQELTEQDPAEGVDWVVGLASPVPRFAASADDLGIAQILGRHLVMRAMSDAHEYEAIQSAFSELSEAERLKLYSRRKQHKLCTVFLHEVAHTLGVPHELASASLMNPHYHVAASGLSDPALEIVRQSLATRARSANAILDADLVKSLRALLSAPNAGWEPRSRDLELAALGSADASSPPAAPAQSEVVTSGVQAPVGTMGGPPIAGLSATEQRIYEQARAELNAGGAARARELAEPLFALHPDSAAVQSLRCDAAMGVGGDWETIAAACSGLSPFGH